MAQNFISVGIEHGQKCWLSTSTLASLRGKFSDYLRISDAGSNFICQAWPCDETECDSILYSCCVCKKLQDSANLVQGIKLLESKVCKEVDIALVICSYKRVKQVKLDLELHPGKVEKFCRNLLYKVCADTNFSIDVTNSPLGEIFGISSIIVDNIKDVHLDKHGTPFEETGPKGYVIDKESVVNIKSIVSRERTRCNQKPVNIGGFDRETKELCDLFEMCLHCNPMIKKDLRKLVPKGILLHGPSGTGKTSLVKHVAYLCNACVITVNGPEVYGARPGETEENLSRILDKALIMSEEGPTILFLDEVDTLCQNQLASDGGKEVNCSLHIASFFDKIVNNVNLIVMGATNRLTSVDRALRRPGRFDKEVMINIPNSSQRLDILKKITSTFPLADNVDLDKISFMTNGYVGADLVAMVREAALMALLCSNQERKLKMHHFEKAVHKVMPSVKKGTVGLVELSPVYWSQIGGLSNVKEQIQQTVEWPIKHPDAFQRMGLACPRGVLLYGPPGCCKTTIVRAAATATNATFIALNGAQMYSPYIGDSERLITEVFQKARAAAPSIIFLDELDSVVGKRSEGSNNRGAQERILSTLLNEMDGIGTRLDEKIHAVERVHEEDASDSMSSDKSFYQTEKNNVLLVAATNRPDLIDDALIRPGRIDRVLYVPPPDKQARLEILKVYTNKMPLRNIDIESLSKQTEFYSGADLQNLCREAALIALTDDMQASSVTMDHFINALSTVEPSLTEPVLKQYGKSLASAMKSSGS